MGASQSLDAFFGSPNIPSNSEQADVYQYLRRVERTLWIRSPFWDEGDVEAAETRIANPTKLEATPRDPFKKMTPNEALSAIPAMLDETWVSPLVALVDCVDPIPRSAGLALLSRIVQRESVAKIFVAVRGMDKAMALLDSQDQQATHLALEVIFALCAGSSGVIRPFCEAGLIGRLTELIKGDNLELVLASLKVLRLTLRQNAVKAELSTYKTLAVLMDLVHSSDAAIAKTAVTCIGLSLPNTENLAELLRLGCIDTFLRLMTPTNSNADAVIFALSLIADETDSIFPREQTTATLGRMLETLRGAAKRSPAASATSFLFASLAKSSIFHSAICSEANLGILAKLLVGSTYALKLLAALSTARHVKEHMCEAESVARMLQYLRGANCSLAFCKLMETTPDALQILALLREHMSSSTFYVDQALNIATRLDHEALHEQVLGFLDGLTSKKNTRALEQIFASDPDRIANLLQASLNTRVQLLGATLLRRLFKRLNSIDIPSTAAQRHLAKLLSASSVDQMVAVAACRVWGNLFQYEDKRLAFAQIPDSVSGLLQLLQRCIGSQPVVDTATIQVSSDLEAEEKKVVPLGLKPLAARSPTDVEAQAEIDDEAEIETLGGEAPARRVVATSKMVDFSLRHADSALAPVARASLHLLQRLACEQPGVPRFVYDANGVSVVMRALQQRPEYAFQELGATSFLVELVTKAQMAPEEQDSSRKLQIKGLQALAALCEGSSPAARASKKELLECEQSAELVRLVSADDDERLCAAWTRALAMGAFASSNNQRRLVSAGLVSLLTDLLRHPSGFVRVPTAQLLAYLAAAPENRGIVVNEGVDALLSAIITGLQSELPGLQRYAALLVANLATRHEGNKVRLGAAGAASPLVDRLSSQRRNVLENVLLAVVKLGSHAGNKVKLGGKVCFEKLLALVHHETLQVAKGAARALAVLVVGNDANKKFLLQCEAPVVAELSALLKGLNGSIVESVMLVLGELAPMPAQALELSRCVDVLSVVKLLTHINPCIARAALLVVRHLTRESFNKTRFGLRECVEALLARLRLGLGGTSGADELEMVELTVTCLANLSFASSNASLIAERDDSLLLLLQLTTSALPTAVEGYLSEKEVSRLMSQGDEMDTEVAFTSSPSKAHQRVDTDNNDQAEHDEEMYESMARNSPKKGGNSREKSDARRQGEVESRSQILNFSAFPSLQTAVLEQTLLVLSNCADHYRTLKVVDILAVAVLCQALLQSSELVARCGCYTLACWLKQNTSLQDAATKRGALQTLSKLQTSSSLVVVEAAAYVLSKLAARGDNPMKLLALDVPATLVHGILRKPANGLKGEEIIADVLTPLLQLHPQTLGKNLSRLVLALLADDSLKFFLPKKTVSLLRACFVHQATSAKTIRNVLRIFALLVTVEEHKTTITLEDSGEALGRTRKIAAILHENDVYVRLPPYILVSEEAKPGTESAKTLEMRRLHTVQIAARLCKALGDQALVWECLDVLRLLCSSPYDEQVIVEEGGVVVLVAYFELWLSVTSGVAPELFPSGGHFIEEMKAAGARSAVENNPLISPDDKALPVALLGMLGYSADLNEEFARALEQFDAARSEAERRERVAYLLRFLERYALTHAPTKEQAIDSFMTYLVADAEKAQTAAMATEHEPEVTKDEQASASKLALTIAGGCLASLVKISGWSPPERSLSATLSGFGELYLSRWDLNALLAVAFARQRGDEDNEFQERPRLAIAQISQVLELAALVRSQLEENSRTGGSGVVVVGQIDARWLCNAFMLVTGIYSSDRSSLARNGELNPVEQVLALVHWLAVNSSTCFEDICRNAALLRAFFAPLTPVFCGDFNGDRAMELFLSLMEMTVNTPTPGAETTASIDELLVEVLKFLYAQVDNGLQHNFLVVDKQLEYTQQEPQSDELGVHNNAVWIVYSLSKDVELVPKLVAHSILETLSDQLLEYDQNSTQRKALGAMSRLAGVAELDATFLQSLISQLVESVRRNVPIPDAHRSVTNALAVFNAILKAGKNRPHQQRHRRPPSQQQRRAEDSEVNIRQVLLKGEGLRIALDLLGVADARIKLEAFRVVSEFVEDHPDFNEVRELLLGSEEQGGSHALLSLVRALSDEARSSALPSTRSGKNDLLLVALTLLNMLLSDEILKMKLTPTTYDVVLQVVVAISATTSNLRVLGESLKALTTMTRAGQVADLCPEAALVSSVEPLVKILQGLTLMTTGGVSDAAAVVELSRAVDTLVRLLSSKSPSIQANAVWVVSNISSEVSLKSAIVARDPKKGRAMHFERIVLQFALAEKNGLDFEGLKAALNAMGAHIKESDVSEIFYESDMVRDNSLSQNEFVVSLAIAHLLGLITNFDSIKDSNVHAPEDVTLITPPDDQPADQGNASKLIAKALDLMVTAYLLFDNDASGTIQTSEVLEQMRQTPTGPNSPRRLERMESGFSSKAIRDERIKELDFDQDGTITFQEFVLTFQRWAGSDDDDDD
ncbi:hypothetical protein JG688_00006470 [Phytophthora aleatoria]|uniref:EF-hand domain-containing protein n=1 Tax=Phytophthora aleatoria TaxID=2496075 RepID=A0A8J5MGP9_9STRA|nr:hypothetical protein JG688_00006470 [Phytophthora aleatoria]